MNHEALVDRFGNNANAFLTLYPGYSFFETGDAALAYVETKEAWVAASEPLCPPEDFARVLTAFAEAAEAKGKASLLLPASRATRATAHGLGFGSLKIGSEPRFDLTRYDARIETVSTAKRLAAKGARVVQAYPDRLGKEKRAELDALCAHWLGTRKMAELKFLNRVEPWTLAHRKKYFCVEAEGRVLAFVAGVPIPPCRGWYLVDLIRHADSPPGSTELLLLESMRMLKEEGALLVSLGVAPLSEMDPDDEPENRLLARALRLVYDHGGLFYNFKSLHQFKLKFHPNQTEAAYLLYRPAKLGPRISLGLSHAWLGENLPRAMWTSVNQRLSSIEPVRTIQKHLNADVVIRRLPGHPAAFLRRMKLTGLLAIVNVAAFILTVDGNLHLDPEISERFAFSVPKLLAGEWRPILGAPFLHWGPRHLFMNLFTLTLFVAVLEYLAGTIFAAWCFFVPALVANPLTSLLFATWMPGGSGVEDVGASLGIFGCGGAVTRFFLRAPLLLGGMAFGTLLYSLFADDPLSLNHLVAAGVGIAVAKWRLARPRMVVAS